MQKIQLIHYTGFAKWGCRWDAGGVQVGCRWGVAPLENGKTGPHNFFQNYFLKNLDFEFW
jgi:hypothetical protein